MTPTIPSVRSRLSAAVVAFVLGFGLANAAIFLISGPDRVVWMVVAGVLMATSAWGVVVADSPRRLSVWAVLGAEGFAVFLLVPLLWAVALAAGDGSTPTSLWPAGWGTGAVSDVLGDDAIARAAGLSVGAALLATAVAVVPALGLAVLLVRTRWRARRLVLAAAGLAVLLPAAGLAVGAGDLLLGADGPRLDAPVLRVAVAQLVIAVPVATWVLTAALRGAPWSLVEAARADGAGRLAVLTRVLLPTVGPAIVVAVLLTAVVTAQDLALGGLVTGPADPTLPALLLDRADDPAATAVVAATGLLWAAPVAVLVLVAPRTITRLLGGSYR